MSNRIDIFAFLHANQRSVNNTSHEISDALRDAGRRGADDLAREIENAAPRVRRAANKVKDATIVVDRAERAANRTREEGAKLLERRLQLETDHADASAARARSLEREIELENRLRAARAGTEKINQQIYEQQRRRDEQKAKADALNSYVRDKNLGLRDKRLARTKANQEGDRPTVKRLSREINADDAALQPARRRQIAENRQLREEEAALATLRERLAGHNEDVSRTETDLKTVRTEGNAAARDAANLEDDLARNREATRRINEDSIRTTEDVTRATRHQEEALRSLHETEEQERRRSERRGGRRGGRFGRGPMATAGNVFTSLPGVPGGPAGAVIGPGVLVAAAGLLEPVVTASQSLALLPAIATAAGAGIATLAIGFNGLGKAIKDMGDPKKFAKDLAALGPAAQQVALEIQFLAGPEGPLGQLARATEETLLKGIPEKLHNLAGQLGPLMKMLTTGIAGAFNRMFTNFSDTLLSAAGKDSLANIVANLVSAFDALAPAIRPFTEAFLKITEVGASFMPRLSDAIVNMANAFNNFIQKSAQDGSLQNFINKGMQGFASLGQILLEIGRRIYEAFGNKTPEDFKEIVDHTIDTIMTLIDAIVGIAEAVDTILPALDAVADAVGGWPVLIAGAVTAWIGLKAVVMPILAGIAFRIGAGGVAGALAGLPAAAATAGAGITAGLAGAAALLAKMAAGAGTLLALLSMGGSSQDPSNNTDTALLMQSGATPQQIAEFEQARVNGDKETMSRIARDVDKSMKDKLGPNPDLASPSSVAIDKYQVPTSWWGGKTPEQLTAWATERSTLDPYHSFDIPAIPETGKGSKAERTHGPEVPYSGDPMSLIQGYQPTAALYNAAGALLDKRQKVAQDEADLNKMLAENTATEDEITKKRNDLEKDKREAVEAEIRLDEAKASANKKALKGLKDTDSAFSEIGAGLDKDLGFSKGLPGLADNLVRFVAALATAPLKGLLAPIAKQGDGSYGLLGMMFGGSAKDTESAGGGPTGGLLGGGYLNRNPAGISSDAALLGNIRPGSYSQPGSGAWDLAKGLGDCSSAVEDLVNIMDGRPTEGRSMSTGNAAEWLTQHGFVPGMGGPGDFRVGYNSGHMQATLPGGTPFNWGSDAAAARGGVGGTGAYDSAFTDHYYRPAGGGQSPLSRFTSPAPATSAPSLPAIASGGDILPPLTNPNTSGLSMPGGPLSAGAPAGGPLSTGMPRGLPTAPLGPVSPADPTFAGAQSPAPGVTPGLTPYTAQGMPQGQQGWQPNSSGGIGFGGGLIGAGLQAAMSAAGTAGAPFGGQAAAAAAQMALQLIDRTTKFGGQLAGIATEGILSTFAPSNPDSGNNPLKDSWLWRAAGALAGATPALGSGGAAMLDKMSQKKQAEDQGQQAQQQGQQGQQSPAQSGPLVNIEQMVQGQQSGKSLGQDIAGQLQQQVILPR